MKTKESHFIQVDGINIKSEDDSVMNLDDVLLNIIRVNSQKTGVLSAYLARRKCYRICKQVTKRVDYKEYVERLLLDNYPSEFKKAELGNKIVVLLCITIPVLLVGAIFFIVGASDFNTYYSWEIQTREYNSYLIKSAIREIITGIVILAVSSIGIWRISFYNKRIHLIGTQTE